MIHYWEEKNFRDLKKTEKFIDLLPIAKSIINRMSKPVAMVSGPISTGGLGFPEKNLKQFIRAIKVLYDSGVNVFDQTPFDDKMSEIKNNIWNKDEYCMPLLEDFYLPLFRGGYIQEVFFLSDWQSSFGAKWEHDQCKIFKIKIHNFPVKLIKQITE
ncbi:MAG: hypothetical protein ACNFW9_05070 [Candidatus Kerfeldbacteria bacterium]|jgi:hypothetical protein